MLKAFEKALKDLGYKISESTPTLLIVYNVTNHLVISITDKKKTTIVHSNSSDVRFKGKIDNTIQLKFILNCIISDL